MSSFPLFPQLWKDHFVLLAYPFLSSPFFPRPRPSLLPSFPQGDRSDSCSVRIQACAGNVQSRQLGPNSHHLVEAAASVPAAVEGRACRGGEETQGRTPGPPSPPPQPPPHAPLCRLLGQADAAETEKRLPLDIPCLL